MSFILDALRKSEHERQRHSAPEMTRWPPVSPSSQFPVWAIAIGSLLILNLAVVIALILMGGEEQQSAAAVPGDTPASSVHAVSAAPQSIGSRVSAAVPQQVATAPAPALADASREERITEPAATLPAPHIPVPSPPVDTASPPMVEPDLQVHRVEALPTIHDVNLQGKALPPLHLDIHVYATQPAERFVYVNNNKYREGERTPEGILIERITREGVILDFKGMRFLLPRQ